MQLRSETNAHNKGSARVTTGQPQRYKPSPHSCIFVVEPIESCPFMWFSPSVRHVLGYSPEELVGRTPFQIHHPDEGDILRRLRDIAFSQDMVAGILYARLRHAKGHYVFLAVSVNVVYDAICGSMSEAFMEPKEKLRAATASDIYVLSPGFEKIFEKQDWITAPIPGFHVADPFWIPKGQRKRRHDGIPKPSEKRTFLILNRFSENDTIAYISNDALIRHPSRFRGKPFYDIVRKSDRRAVRADIESGKRWASSSPSGIEHSPFSYNTFTIEIAAESMQVQGVCASYSDGILLIIRRKTSFID